MTRTPQSDAIRELAVESRYSRAAVAREAGLCCPVDYDPRYLAIIPDEILERDYGCGDPTRFVRTGETVLDLGSGGGKACFIAAQVVGPTGRVVGVDCNPEMLELARRHRSTVADQLGYSNVDFHCGLIQDLRLDLDLLSSRLEARPIRNQTDWLQLRRTEEQLRREQPMIADESIDCVISNCVLNLVLQENRERLFGEIFRVLRPGGRAAISDIVSDEDVPESLRNQPDLWSGCISGAYRESKFVEAFEAVGFHGISIVSRGQTAWRVVEGIEFRSMTVVAYKGKQGPCLERRQALVYQGPFRRVEDDDGHVFVRGERIAVCDKTYRLLQSEPYSELFEPIEPREIVPIEQAEPFDCTRSSRRHPRESKGAEYRETTSRSDASCCPEGCC